MRAPTKKQPLILLFALLLLGCSTYYLTRPKEPIYQGKSLTEWLQLATKPTSPLVIGMPFMTGYAETQKAVVAMGTNAIPTLLKMYQASDSSLERRITTLLKRQSLIQIHLLNAGEKHQLGQLGLGILAQNNLLTADQLAPLINSPDRNQREDALGFLSSIKPNADVHIPILLRFLKDTDDKNRFTAVKLFYRFFPAEAEKAGVRELFPEFKPPPASHASTKATLLN